MWFPTSSQSRASKGASATEAQPQGVMAVRAGVLRERWARQVRHGGFMEDIQGECVTGGWSGFVVLQGGVV